MALRATSSFRANAQALTVSAVGRSGTACPLDSTANMAVVSEELPSLGRLVGEPLNAVTFVMDYVQFHFNGPLLTDEKSEFLRFRCEYKY